MISTHRKATGAHLVNHDRVRRVVLETCHVSAARLRTRNGTTAYLEWDLEYLDAGGTGVVIAIGRFADQIVRCMLAYSML